MRSGDLAILPFFAGKLFTGLLFGAAPLLIFLGYITSRKSNIFTRKHQKLYNIGLTYFISAQLHHFVDNFIFIIKPKQVTLRYDKNTKIEDM